MMNEKENVRQEEEIEIETQTAEIEVEPKEQKDRGGKQNNGQPHANQYTQGRNDDRGRKE
jgi:hypothetical protein